MRKLFLIIFLSSCFHINAQELEPEFEAMGTNLWLSSYNKFRIGDKLYWAGEMHYRRIGSSTTPYVDRMAQIYNRHGLNYVVSPNFNFTVGGVFRLNFTPQPSNPEYDPLYVEPRIWHQYLFVLPFPRFMLYNRIRIEHRWKRGSRTTQDEFKFGNRWRYNFYMKIPINNDQLKPGTFYVSPSMELIMQSGKNVVGSFVEDLRLYGNVGYIASPRVSSSLGLMYTTGQNLNDPTLYRRRLIVRLSTYISLDFRKEEQQIPTIKLSD
ncbi:DUF2490 domain-containing protein [Marivirga harenae]|uniref:DUF2490 domain-containing protein n=1 Tax=Marivirga harenae TaxID=2010992 RepID=UPI0026E07F77|nr:DUF2490 domain-containing protein [Marivirga harenae]WKV12117.1 DUF2490 domain-containing protein [Marivirga harenae]